MDELEHDWLSDWTDPDVYYTKKCRRCGLSILIDIETGYAASPWMHDQEVIDCNEMLIKRTMVE